jgi:hypothetical protein
MENDASLLRAMLSPLRALNGRRWPLLVGCAVLLAALRSAVLWRQLGGSLWDFGLRRRTMLEAIEHWLE